MLVIVSVGNMFRPYFGIFLYVVLGPTFSTIAAWFFLNTPHGIQVIDDLVHVRNY